jgi:hypothetical protein
MEPRIDRTQFGSVTIDGKVFDHDVIIRLGGQVKKRKKKLSKAVYGTSHTMSLAEAEHLYQDGAERLLIGSGQEGRSSCRRRRPPSSRGTGARWSCCRRRRSSRSGTRPKAP